MSNYNNKNSEKKLEIKKITRRFLHLLRLSRNYYLSMTSVKKFAESAKLRNASGKRSLRPVYNDVTLVVARRLVVSFFDQNHFFCCDSGNFLPDSSEFIRYFRIFPMFWFSARLFRCDTCLRFGFFEHSQVFQRNFFRLGKTKCM